MLGVGLVSTLEGTDFLLNARETPMVPKEGSGMKVAGDAIEMLTMLMS
jgi:hypothetical protein